MKFLSIKQGFEPGSSGWNSGALSQSCSCFNVSRGKHNTHIIINTIQTKPVWIFLIHCRSFPVYWRKDIMFSKLLQSHDMLFKYDGWVWHRSRGVQADSRMSWSYVFVMVLVTSQGFPSVFFRLMNLEIQNKQSWFWPRIKMMVPVVVRTQNPKVQDRCALTTAINKAAPWDDTLC